MAEPHLPPPAPDPGPPRSCVEDDLGDSRPVREAALLFGAMFVSGVLMVIVSVRLFGDEPQLRKSFRHPDAKPTRGHIEPGRTNVTTRPIVDE